MNATKISSDGDTFSVTGGKRKIFICIAAVISIIIILRIIQFWLINPLVDSADNTFSIKTKVLNDALKERQSKYRLAFKHERGVPLQGQLVWSHISYFGKDDGELYTPVKPGSDLRDYV